MFLKHTVSIFTVKWMLAKLRLYRFKAQPAERTCSEGRTSNNVFWLFFQIVFKFGMGILWKLLLIAILLSLRVLDAMLELFKLVVELYTYACISLQNVHLCRLSPHCYELNTISPGTCVLVCSFSNFRHQRS